MILEKKTALKPLIQSSGGIHLTAYLKNTGDLEDLKSQLRAAISKAELEIEPAMAKVDRRLFLAPLHLLLNNDRLLKSFKQNVAIFRNAKVFRVLALPIEIEFSCVVATTFHVKPLLRWMRVDQEFLILGLEDHVAHLYSGSQHSMRLIDSLPIEEGFLKASAKRRLSGSENSTRVCPDAINALATWVSKHTLLAKPKLFVAGDARVAQAFKKAIFYPKLSKTPVSQTFSPTYISVLSAEIRTQLEQAEMSDFEKTITEFHMAEDYRAVRRNIFQIAKAVAQGRVRKLLVTDGVKIFGKFNSSTGALAIHPRDLDHEDDDILDDLAQSVLAKGGEVVVTAKGEIPDGHLAWALLDYPSLDIGLPAKTAAAIRSRDRESSV